MADGFCIYLNLEIKTNMFNVINVISWKEAYEIITSYS